MRWLNAPQPERRSPKSIRALSAAPSINMVLFGRMAASDPSLNYDAAAQVAHSISTYTIQTEFDYFTAVDDLAPSGSLMQMLDWLDDVLARPPVGGLTDGKHHIGKHHF